MLSLMDNQLSELAGKFTNEGGVLRLSRPRALGLLLPDAVSTRFPGHRVSTPFSGFLAISYFPFYFSLPRSSHLSFWDSPQTSYPHQLCPRSLPVIPSVATGKFKLWVSCCPTHAVIWSTLFFSAQPSSWKKPILYLCFVYCLNFSLHFIPHVYTQCLTHNRNAKHHVLWLLPNIF